MADQTPTAEAIDIALNTIAEDEALPRSLWIIANPKVTDPYGSKMLPHQEPIQRAIHTAYLIEPKLEGPPLARFIAEEFGFDQWARPEVYSDASITRATKNLFRIRSLSQFVPREAALLTVLNHICETKDDVKYREKMIPLVQADQDYNLLLL
jgi:hypothetical protein